MDKNKFVGHDFHKVKDQLKNRGMKTETVLFEKSIKIGYDDEQKKKYPIFLECTIKEIDLSTEVIFQGDNHKIITVGNIKETINHKHITKYQTLSICGSSKFMDGQIIDHIKDLEGAKLGLQRIIEIWKEWHLNDMQPNCIHQKSFNCNTPEYPRLAALETLKCPKGYKYGSKWLIKELPKEVIIEIMGLFTNYKL